MQITYDPPKRDKTLLERGLDFASAAEVFAGHTYDREDDRTDYGEVPRASSRSGDWPIAWWSWCGRSVAMRAMFSR